jgi:hypothetical protein
MDTDTDTALRTAATTVHTEIARADGKAGVLLTAYSLLLAVFLATIPGRSLPGPAALLIALGVLGLGAATTLILSSVRPCISGAPRGTFLYWATCTPHDLTTDLADTGHRAEHVIRLSRMARRKYRRIRWAIDLTMTAFGLLTVGLLISL